MLVKDVELALILVVIEDVMHSNASNAPIASASGHHVLVTIFTHQI